MKPVQVILTATLAFGINGLIADELPGIEESPVVEGRSETDPGLGATAYENRPGPGDEEVGLPEPQASLNEDRFDELDIDQDGTLSRTEAEADPEVALIFLDADEDSDGQLSSEEFTEYEPEEEN